MPYFMVHKEHFWNVSVLQSAHTSYVVLINISFEKYKFNKMLKVKYLSYTTYVCAFCLLGNNRAPCWFGQPTYVSMVRGCAGAFNIVCAFASTLTCPFSTIMHLMWVNNMSCDLIGFVNRMKFHKPHVHTVLIKKNRRTNNGECVKALQFIDCIVQYYPFVRPVFK
jgi:hypothetical protein